MGFPWIPTYYEVYIPKYLPREVLLGNVIIR